jgi:hypothetical protein
MPSPNSNNDPNISLESLVSVAKIQKNDESE